MLIEQRELQLQPKGNSALAKLVDEGCC
jgi:hypothetical protein